MYLSFLRRQESGRLICCFLFFCLLFACQTPTQPAPPSEFTRRTIPTSPNKKGVHTLLIDTFRDWEVERWESHLDYASAAVGADGYVTQLVRLDDLDVEKWQYFMDLCERGEIRPILRLATTANPDGWNTPPRDVDGTYRTVATQFANFIRALDWPTTPIIIIHNEPNHGHEWNGTPNAADYARYLIDVANAIHHADPNAVVLNAGFDNYAPHTNGQAPQLLDSATFLNEMLAAQPNVFTYIDAWASHPYPLGAFIEPPEMAIFQIDRINGAEALPVTQPPKGIHNRGIQGYEWELWWLEQHGVTDLPVLITETGWRFGEAGYPSEAEAACYLQQALQIWNADPRVVAITPFAFNGDPSRWSHSNWLNLADDGTVLSVTDLFRAWQGDTAMCNQTACCTRYVFDTIPLYTTGMKESKSQPTTEYRSFMVRFQRECCPDDCCTSEWQILVRSVADGTQTAIMSLAELTSFLADATEIQL